MTELAILIPVLRRPHRVEPTVTSIRQVTPGLPKIVFILDPNDEEEWEAVESAIETGSDVVAMEQDGNYAHKINEAVKATTEPLLFFGADDLRFEQGWLEEAKKMLTEGIGVVGTNDLCNKLVMMGKLATHPLVTREYTKLGTIDDPDRVLHEAYRHEFVDREFTETAIYRDAFAFADLSVVEHLHPMIGKAPSDPIYAQMESRMRQGRRVYAKRTRLWKSR